MKRSCGVSKTKCALVTFRNSTVKHLALDTFTFSPHPHLTTALREAGYTPSLILKVKMLRAPKVTQKVACKQIQHQAPWLPNPGSPHCTSYCAAKQCFLGPWEGKGQAMGSDVSTGQLLPSGSPVCSAQCARTVGRRRGLTCSGGNAQEPAGVFQSSPEHLWLHGTSSKRRVPAGQAAEALA